MKVIDSKEVEFSLKSSLKFPLIMFCISFCFFIFACFFFYPIFQIILYENIFLVLFSISFSICFGIMPFLIKRKAPNPPANEDPESISIIIPVFNDASVLEKNLQNLLRLKYPNLEILIIYSTKSTDKTAEIASHFAQENKNIRIFQENTSKGNALNIGIKNAKSEFLLFLDSDTFIYDGFIEGLMPYFFNDETVKCVTSLAIGLNVSKNFLTELEWSIYNYTNLHKIGINKLLSNVHFSGFGAIWRKSALVECGGFVIDTLTEDIELEYRQVTKYPQWKGVYDDGVFCYQYYPVDTKSFYHQYLRWTIGTYKYLLKTLKSFFSLRFRYKILNVVNTINALIFPLIIFFTAGMSTVQFFANFIPPYSNLTSGLIFAIIGFLYLAIIFFNSLIFISSKYRGKSRIYLSRRTILSGIALTMFVSGFFFVIVALNALKELIKKKSTKNVFIKVDKSKLVLL